jgi:hypothetical protein
MYGQRKIETGMNRGNKEFRNGRIQREIEREELEGR